MYKIMLVEDEPAVLYAMTHTLDWNALSFHTPVACADGQAAIDAIAEGFVPDVVVTDICMPFIDGVQLTEYVASHCPVALVVMLTGYDDFAYAHKAIKLKVYDYVLKPITPKSLCELAGRLRDTLDERRVKNADAFDTLARALFLSNLLLTRPDATTVAEGLRIHKIQTEKPFWMALAVDLALPAAETAQQTRTNELLRYGLANITQELAQALPEVVFCGQIKEICGLILNTDTLAALDTAVDLLSAQVAQACTALNEHATMGVGTAVESPQTLCDSYTQAVLALHYRFFFGHIPCIRSADVALQHAETLDYLALEAQFAQAVKNGSRAGGCETIRALCAALQEQTTPYDQCLRYSQRMMLQLLEWMGEYLSAEDLAQLEHVWDETNLFSAATLHQLEQLLLRVCNLAFDSFERAGEDDSAVRVRKAETYIREHCGDETLSLHTMKDVFSISISYFSAIFKTYTGSTFVEYLTQVRIEKARELLEHTEKRAGEVAQEVGFADPHYFSVTFKRMTGLTPREYRSRYRAGAAEGEL